MATQETKPSTAAQYSVDFEEEVRLAVVMYGGVSLAIYMYGVAEELWRLVRATCPAVPYSVAEPPEALMEFEDAESTEPVYRRVALARHGGDDKTMRTRFVVDIVSGTSAGGINGVCLATALANNSSLAELKEIWFKVGALGTLLNDKDSVLNSGIDDLVFEEPPASLLNGRRMLGELIGALRRMSGPDEEVPSSPLVDELDLWVTATDLEGIELPIKLANVVTTERRHANRYHFRFFRRSSPTTPEENRNDFSERTIDFLAYAARATSAFPFAFEPIRLRKLPPLAEIGDWASFYPDYSPNDFADRPFADGGILDNKPFTYATDALVQRRATLPVDRKLIYIEPDPAELDVVGAGGQEKQWNAIDTVLASLLSLPRVETIREDLSAVIARNREIGRLRSIVDRAGEESLDVQRVLARLAFASSDVWANMTLAQILSSDTAAWGTSYAPYHRLKVASTIDELARLVVHAVGLNPTSDEAWAIREIVQGWTATRYAEKPNGDLLSDSALLAAFDLPFRRRRLAFVYRKLNELQSDGAATVLTAAGLASELPGHENPPAAFSRLRLALSDAQAPLYALEETVTAPNGPIATTVATNNVSRESLVYLLEASSPSEHSYRLGEILDGSYDAFTGLAEGIGTSIAAALEQMRRTVDDALGPHFADRVDEVPTTLEATLQHALRYYYDAFESYDLVSFPLQYATALGETNPVEIIRVSPADVSALEGRTAATNLSLMGSGLGHFAGFLDERWRRHDMMLGRLHGAECLIRALAPEAVAGGLISDAQKQIIAEWAEEETGASQADPDQWFQDTYQVPTTPEPSPKGTARRASPIIVTIVQNILDSRQSDSAQVAGTAWTTLSRMLPDRPGGWAAVKSVGSVLLTVNLFRRVAAGVAILLLALLLGGCGLFVAGFVADIGVWWQVLGGLLASLSAAILGGILWLALAIVGRVRKFITGRVDAVLGPYANQSGSTG